ncbi:MAG: hydantoinase B/oxoprolinase family protein [Longimicrobiales bacterium]
MQRASRTLDPVRLEVYRHLFTALAEEMGAALRRSAYSPNIKERRDYSCALFDGAGRMIAMGDHMPVHLGAMPMSVAAALADLAPLAPGDVAVLNDPFAGGTHLPDITVISPVYADGDPPLGYLAARAHHADVGGMAGGSMPLAREVYQEGLRLPPIRLVTAGRRNHDVWRVIQANVRTPDEREGDLSAQLAALVAGERRLVELVSRRGRAEVETAMAALLAYSDRLVRQGLTQLPAGVYQSEDFLDDDGFGSEPLAIRVRIDVHGDAASVDFAGTAPQAEGGVNAVAAITTSAVRYAFRCVLESVLGQPLPAGGGEMAAITIVTPEGSLVNARPPASVAAGNVETSQRITDVVLAALAVALPDRVPAQSQGTMNNLTVSGIDPRTHEPFAYYETMAGGMGASRAGPGLSAVHVHMSNSLNTPIEAIEHAYPLRVRGYALRHGSGGRGHHPGGDGVRRDIELLTDSDVSLLTERRRFAPAGLAGGGDGAPGENVLIRGGAEQPLPGKVTLRLRAGDILSLRSPGGGGWGR